jgi:hypothetical protein
VASDAELLAWLKDAATWKDHDARVALLIGARARSTPELAAIALEMIAKTADPVELSVLAWAARVVGASDATALAPKLLALLEDPATRPYAALAIMLGGDEELVTRGMLTWLARARIGASFEQDLNTLRALFLDSFDGREVVAADVPRLARVARNVDVMARLGAITDVDERGRGPLAWSSTTLSSGLARLDLAITVPGALDQTLFLDAVRRSGDLRLLRYLRETGALRAMEKTSEARRALRELEAATGPTELSPPSDPYFSKPKD